MGFRSRIRSVAGFTLSDVMVAAAIGATMAGISVPVAKRAVESMRLSSATRDVERELQTARLRAVTNNRPIQLRFNCPVAGQYRIIEVTGVAATDTRADRCEESAFPYPGPIDDDPVTPYHDGPVRQLTTDISVAGSDFQFTPRGTARKLVNGATQPINGTETITVTRGPNSATVTINALGKIRLQVQ